MLEKQELKWMNEGSLAYEISCSASCTETCTTLQDDTEILEIDLKMEIKQENDNEETKAAESWNEMNWMISKSFDGHRSFCGKDKKKNFKKSVLMLQCPKCDKSFKGGYRRLLSLKKHILKHHVGGNCHSKYLSNMVENLLISSVGGLRKKVRQHQRFALEEFNFLSQQYIMIRT